MSLTRSVYNALFKRTSTFALTIVVGAVFFERFFDLGGDAIYNYINRGKQWNDIKGDVLKRAAEAGDDDEWWVTGNHAAVYHLKSKALHSVRVIGMYTSHLLHHTLSIPHQYTSSLYLINLASLMTSNAVSVTLLMKIPTGWGISLRCEANMRHHRGGTSIKHVATGLLVLITTAAFIYSGSSSRTLRPGPKNRMLIATPLATAVALAANSDLAVAIIP